MKKVMKKVILGLLTFVLVAGITVYVQANTGINALPDANKRHAMLRLEDVGPGGNYSTLDDLGRLRAIFEYLEKEQVPFHVAVIPRWKYLQPNGTWYEKGIDDQNPDLQVKKFIELLQDAETHGAVLGMHGYTHQYGDHKMDNNNQDTGIGAEFHVKGAPQTDQVAYAADRITKSLAAFDKAGLQPGFWESPHYNDTREQEQVFRSFMGILYQPDFYSLRSLKDLNVYESENHYSRNTLGSVYIPAPLKYIHDKDNVEKVLAELPTYQGLASLYYHPFLEYPYLEPEKDSTGKPLIRDGLPVYTYKAGVQSNLQRLINGVKQQGFRWVSIHDAVPFSPAHRIDLPSGTKASDLLLGDVCGYGHADVVVRAENQIQVIQGTYKWPRNRAQEPSQVWLKRKFLPEEQLLLADMNGDQKQDLVVYNRKTGEVSAFYSNGKSFGPPVSFGELPAGLDSLQPFHMNGGGNVDLIGRQQKELNIAVNQGGKFEITNLHLPIPSDAALLVGDVSGQRLDDIIYYSPNEKTIRIYPNSGTGKILEPISIKMPFPDKKAQVLVSDTRGNGKSDLVIYYPEEGLWQILQGSANFHVQPADNMFGPWSRGTTRVGYTADFDGNGKGDIASYSEEQHTLDLALSFRGSSK
ncbi:DUF2334 domain-containing protein [Effusibacillus dendaii]|uniref:DUF2334 domain-containing protein n=1 Tax=Effusibacillus dendaii TaxID=2743772 RepID=A0A7I8D656_9BACL|nr:DUF2334 domain-containing protein [Effusibacillus dendaii]BCJ85633.1 hypothetical protein skT53_06180 [Effusibacillus dendaii]